MSVENDDGIGRAEEVRGVIRVNAGDPEVAGSDDNRLGPVKRSGVNYRISGVKTGGAGAAENEHSTLIRHASFVAQRGRHFRDHIPCDGWVSKGAAVATRNVDGPPATDEDHGRRIE